MLGHGVGLWLTLGLDLPDIQKWNNLINMMHRLIFMINDNWYLVNYDPLVKIYIYITIQSYI